MDALPDLSSLKVSQPANTRADSTPNLRGEPDINFDDLPFNPADGMPHDMLPMPITKSPELIEQETEQKIILQLYIAKFPTDLSILSSELSHENLNRLDLDALKSLRNKADMILGGSTGAESKKRLFNSMIYMIEKVSCYGGLRLEGLTSNLLNDEFFQKDLMRLSLKYLSTNETKPEICCLMKLFGTMTQIYANNEIKQEQEIITQKVQEIQEPKKDVTDNVEKISSRYSDL